MNSFERVMNTLQGKPVDRFPVLAVLNVFSSMLTSIPLRTLYTDVDAYVASQKCIIDAFGIDMALSTFDYSVIGEAFGSEVAWFSDQAPNIKKPLLPDVDVFLSMPLPDIQKTGRLPMALTVSRRLADLYGGTVPVFAAIPGPCSLPALIFGLEKWLDLLLFDEERSRRVMKRTGEFFIAWSNALLEAGNTALIYTEGVTAKEVIYRELFEEQFLPHLQTLFPQIKGPIIFHHTGGSINHILDLLPRIPGLIATAIGSKDSLLEARNLAGTEMSLIGNLDNLGFPSATPEAIYNKSMQCLKEMSPSAHFFLSNSGADIPMGTPKENIESMVRASMDFAEMAAE